MNEQQTWLDDYVDYASELTDAPTVFHRFVGLTVLSAAMGNRWGIPYHEGELLSPSLWCLLVANSTTMHKSVSAKIGLRLAEAAGVLKIPSYGSREAMTDLLAKHQAGIMFADEFDQFLRGMSRDYAAGRGFFTSLYDGWLEPQAFRLNGSHGSTKVSVSFVSSGNLSWLTDQLKETDIAGGLLPRFMLVPAYVKDRPVMELPPTMLDHTKRDRLVTGLRWVAGQEHICHRADEADALYRTWYRRSITSELDQTRGEAWPQRIATVCHKLSMVYHAAKKGVDGKITGRDMQRACETTTWLLNALKHLITSELAITKIEKELQSLKRVLRKEADLDGWVSHSTALRYVHLDARQFQQVLTTALEADLIELGKAKRGHPPIRLKVRTPGEDDA